MIVLQVSRPERIIEDSGKIIPVSIAILLAKFTKNIVLVFIFG